MTTTVSQKEIEHFARDSGHWWDEDGPFKPLHRLNPVRLQYIRDELCAHFGRDARAAQPLKGLKILDVGCGGGIVCEPLARLGANVTGIDADKNAVSVAEKHARKGGLDIVYICGSAEDVLREKKGYFDAVLALEIVEHVADVDLFVKNASGLCKKGGLLIFSTLNRTARSFALGIVAAEYLLRWVPQGTHNWEKFIRPSELAAALRQSGASPKDVRGLCFNVRSGDFYLSDKDVAVNYFMTAEK